MSHFFRATITIAAKDLRVELRTREVVVSMGFFVGLVALLFAFAFIREGQAPPDAAAGILWIAIALSGTLGLSRAFDREREAETFSALLLAPVPRAAIYLGKLCGMLVFLAIAEAVAVPLVALLFDAPLLADPARVARLGLLLALGTLGYAAVGCLFAAMLARSRARHVLLGLLLYPIIIPVLIAGARGTQALLLLPEPDLDAVSLWTRILALFDVAFVILALWTFEPLTTD